MTDNRPQGMDIRAKVRGVASDADFVGPTPNNTPVQPAPIAARVVSERPSVSGIIEEAEDEEPTTSGSGLSSLSSHPFAGNQRLINMLQGKLGSLLGRSSGYVESLPEPIRRRINGLKYLQKKHTELESEFHKEILELEKKYLNLYRPLYEKRTKIILGQLEPTDEEVEAGRSDDEEEKEGEAPAVTVDVPTDAGIPEFWLTTLKNHGALGEMITEEDEEPLKKLRDIRMEYLEDRPGFRLLFEFDENDYFTNKVLTKTYYYQSSSFGDLVYESSEGCQIDWKEGKDLTVTIETKKQRHRTTNRTRVIKRAVPNETFFNFFDTIQLPEDEELDEERQEELDEYLEADYELAEEFKEKIIPHAVDWFTGKALQYENADMDDEYEDEEDLYYAGTTEEEDESEEDY